MQKIQTIIKKYEYPFIAIIILITIIGIAVNVEMIPSDAFWNFGNIYKMYSGEQIYKDINIIVTPLFFIIGKLFMDIFGGNFISYQIYNILVTTIFFILIYRLFRNLNIEKLTSMTYIIICLAFMTPLYMGATNYNVIAMLFSIIGITNLIKNVSNARTSILQGLVIFFIFLSKQNIGIFYIIGLLIYEMIFKKEIKYLLGSIFTFVVGLVFISIVFELRENLYNFISYTFLGIREFSKQNFYFTIKSCIAEFINIAIIVFALIIIYNGKMNIAYREKENIKLLLSFSIPFIFIAFPIFNSYHLLLSSLLSYILLIYILTVTIKQIRIKKITVIVTIFMITISICLFVDFILKVNSKSYIFKGDHPYKGMLINDEKYQEMQEICNFIEENNKEGISVKILSYRAMWYLVQLHQFNGKMDLPFYGNLGKDGEDGLIEDIKKMKNTKILILKEGELRLQESKKMDEFIRQNYKLVEEISMFEVYYIK